MGLSATAGHGLWEIAATGLVGSGFLIASRVIQTESAKAREAEAVAARQPADIDDIAVMPVLVEIEAGQAEERSACHADRLDRHRQRSASAGRGV